jgi:hypothetical protein
VRWIIVSNQPFTEIENDEFRDMMSYARRSIGAKMLKADSVRSKVIAYSENMREDLKKLLVVSEVNMCVSDNLHCSAL